MSQKVTKSKFKPCALEYFRKIEETGEEVIITDHGRPVLRVVPYKADPAEALKTLRNTVLKYERPLAPTDEEWEALK